MNNTRQYSIVINGVEQSVKAVDALLQKIDALDERITKLQKLNIDLGAIQNSVSKTDNSGSKYDAAKSEAAAQKEIANQIALQNAENQKALQLLVQKKQETKEQVKIQQQIAQGVRDTNGEYANTLNGQRALLSEMKKQIGNMDIDDAATKAFAEQINQVTEKIKEMEEAYGTFTRNVGNYKSAAEGFQGFNVTIGETVRNFGSLREAAKTIKNEMMGIDTTTAEGRAQFEAYEQALHDVSIAQDQMADAADRAASSSKGLHDTLEMMEGLTAVAGIGQGVSSLFGLDSTALGEQITKLQSLMMILQSIKTLQDQMERGVGGGGWIAKLWKGLDHPIASLKKLSAGLKTTKADMTSVGAAGGVAAGGMTAFSAATTTATAAVKAFGKATVILFVLQLLVEVIDALIEGFKALGKWLFSLGDDSADAARAIDNVGEAAESAGQAIDSYNDALSRKVQMGMIDAIEAAGMALENYDKQLQKYTADMYDVISKLSTGENGGKWQDAFNGLSFKKTAEEAISAMQDMSAQMSEMDKSSEEYKEAMAQYGRQIVVEMTSMSSLSREEVAKFIEAVNSDGIARNALTNLIDSLPEESRDSFQKMLDNFNQAANGMLQTAAQLQNNIVNMLNNIHTGYLNMYDKAAEINERYAKKVQEVENAYKNATIPLPYGKDQILKELEAQKQGELKALQDSQNKQNGIVKNGGNTRIKTTKSTGRARVSAAKNTANELEAVERRLQNDKIAIMRDGLGKTLAQLDLERRNRIEQAQKLRELGKKGEEKYQEEMASITALYAKKEYDAKKEWADKWEEYQKQLGYLANQRAREYEQRANRQVSLQNENFLDKQSMIAEGAAIENIVRLVETGENQIIKRIGEARKEMKELLDTMSDIESTAIAENGDIVDEEAYNKLDELVDKYGKLDDELRKLHETLDIKKMAISDPYYLFDEWKTYYDSLYTIQKKYAEKEKQLKLTEIESERNDATFDVEEDYMNNMKDIEEKFKQHYQDIEDEYNQHLDEMQAMDDEAVEAALKYAGEMGEAFGWESEEYAMALAEYEALIPEQIALVRERDEKLEQLERDKESSIGWLTEMYNLSLKRIEETANEERLKAQNDFIRESQTATANYYSGLLNELQVFQNKYQQKLEKLPEKSKNAWGILNLNAYSKGINDLKATFNRLVEDIENEQKELIIKLANNEISLGDFNTAYNELEGLKEEANETIENLTNMGKNKIGEFIESINTYIQAVGQGVQELLSTVWDAQSAALDAQQEALEKANSELEKQLDKQQQITQRHADKINQIEDELSTARGDRRQHLIDALSAQIAAQRASLAAEQRIQKQKEANEKKQDALDKKRKEAQRKQDITSAIISTALATANGLATKPFVPVGIAMGALAAALGAAQVSIIASKHYAKGGLLEGPSHSQGGIPVGNTGIEVEGKEYIVNKRSTAKNFGLIEYINRSNKQLDINDIMAYFDSAASRSVKGVRSKFADGGQLPTLNDEIDVTSQLQTVVVNQDQRPIYVTVRDINNAQENYRNVQVLAGLK